MGVIDERSDLCTMLHVLDFIFSFLHIVFTLFNLIGWVWWRTRRIHLVTILLTALSWFVLGNWYGWGYCFLTDWQWTVKEKLGEKNLPSSFIKYFADKIFRIDSNPQFISILTLICFVVALILSIYLNFFRSNSQRRGVRIKNNNLH